MNFFRLLNDLNEGYNIRENLFHIFDFVGFLFSTISAFCTIELFLILVSLFCVCAINARLPTPPLMNSTSLLNESNETCSELFFYFSLLVSLCCMFCSASVQWVFFLSNQLLPPPLSRVALASSVLSFLLMCSVEDAGVLAFRVFLCTCVSFGCIFCACLYRGVYRFVCFPCCAALLCFSVEAGVAFMLTYTVFYKMLGYVFVNIPPPPVVEAPFVPLPVYDVRPR